MTTSAMTKLTVAQRDVLESLYDVATHEGGSVTIKNRYHSAAHALIRRGLVQKHEQGMYRPRYQLTDAGRAFWQQQAVTP